MIIIYDLLPCSYYEGLVTALEVCFMSPCFVFMSFARVLEICRMSFYHIRN